MADPPPPLFRVAAGSGHTAVIDFRNGSSRVFCFGEGEDGQLGLGDAEQRTVPTELEVFIGEDADDVCCGSEHTFVLSSRRKKVWSWGWGDFGRLGGGNRSDVLVPRPVPALEGVVIRALACGDTHCLAVLDDGQLVAWGRNNSGQLGLGTKKDQNEPQPVLTLQGQRVVSVGCGAEHSIVCTDEGAVYSFGWGQFGNLGLGDTEDRDSPERVLSLDGLGVTKVTCGWRHSLAVLASGALYSFGWCKYGQLGHGDNNDQWLPRRLATLDEPVQSAAGGWRHTAVVTASGRMYCWGWNRFGQVGNASFEDTNGPGAPLFFPGAPGAAVVQSMTCGWRHTLAVLAGGGVYSWGRGASGQLGHGNTECHNRPQLIDAFGPPAGAAAAASPDAASAAPVWAVPTGADARKAAGSEQDVATVPTVRRGEKDALVPDRPEVDAGVELTRKKRRTSEEQVPIFENAI